ncbi:hypothetical protein [Sulfuriferula nivalis]|uniref:Lipoprotein n=1 Tax=Sulfuriferula nivalis TaxID=2675298 RepID=A0A809RHQ7_9PROT|nr:hypothetical protein [Sulfuriferula nivalis]BBP01075.1 hypothetical protein SFSGTM_17830 [Sulfuriferula nivalis]
MLQKSSKAILITVLTGFIAATATSAMAESKFEKTHPRRDEVNDRLHKQDKRINHEVKEGDMSKQEAHKLHKEDNQVRQEERDMAHQDGGHITNQDQKALNQQENGISKKIGQ